MDKFKKFWAYKVLPLVYDSSLSYLEVLQKLVTKINEVITTTGEMAANVVEALKNSEAALNTANEAENTAQTALDSVPTKTSELTNDSGFVDEEEAADAAPVQSVNGKTGDVITFNFGVCDNSVSTVAKTVSIPNVTELFNGLLIYVQFTNGNAVTGITLKVNNFDAYPVYAFGTTELPANSLSSGEVIELIYINSTWVLTRGGIASTTRYGVIRLSNSTSSTSTSMAATSSAVKTVKDLIPTKTSELTNDSEFTTRANVLAWSNVTNTDTLAQAQAKLITTPGYLRTWAYGPAAAYCPSGNTCVYTAYCMDDSLDYLYLSAVDTITGEIYIADKTGVWHKIPAASSVLPAQTSPETITFSGYRPVAQGYASTATKAYVFMPMPNNAAGAAVDITGTWTIGTHTQASAAVSAVAVAQVTRAGIYLAVTSSGLTSGAPVTLKCTANASITITWS